MDFLFSSLVRGSVRRNRRQTIERISELAERTGAGDELARAKLAELLGRLDRRRARARRISLY